jgi:hypothetical protein
MILRFAFGVRAPNTIIADITRNAAPLDTSGKWENTADILVYHGFSSDFWLHNSFSSVQKNPFFSLGACRFVSKLTFALARTEW